MFPLSLPFSRFSRFYFLLFLFLRFFFFFYLLHCISTSLLAIIRDDDFPRSHFSSFFPIAANYLYDAAIIDQFVWIDAFPFYFLMYFFFPFWVRDFFIRFVYNRYIFYLFNNIINFATICIYLNRFYPIVFGSFFYRLKLECEKLASEKTEMQRHYVMVRHFVSFFLCLSSLRDRVSLFFYFSRVGSDPNPKALGRRFSFLIAEISRKYS